MTKAIKTESAAAQTAGDALGKGVGEFSRIKIGRFSGLAPVTGNQEHDGAVSRSLLAFLTSWESVMKKDGKDILAADQALHQADKRTDDHPPSGKP